MRQAEAALDPVDVVAEEAVQRCKSDATAFVGQDLFMFEGFFRKSVVIKCRIEILIIERGSQLDIKIDRARQMYKETDRQTDN